MLDIYEGCGTIPEPVDGGSTLPAAAASRVPVP
jgi:hypothetical protein